MYKAITTVEKLCRRLMGAARSHAQSIADSVAGTFRGSFRGAYPNLLELFDIIRQDLKAIRRQVIDAERSLMASLTEDQRGRAVRDSSFSSLREQMLAVRKIIDAVYGPGASDIVFMKLNSFVHFDPVSLYRQGELVHDRLLDPNLELPEKRLDVGVDLQKMAREMEPNLEQLGDVLEELQLQETEKSLAKKETLLVEASQKALRSARLMEALADYAGLPGIARRIRLSSHTSSAQAPEGDEPAAAEQAAPASAEGGPAEGPAPAETDASDSAETAASGSDTPPADGASDEASTAT